MRATNIYNDTYNIIGSKIKEIRISKKITQEDLCSRMQVLGFQISRSDISKLENGKKFIKDFEIVGFSKALRTDISVFFEGPKKTA